MVEGVIAEGIDAAYCTACRQKLSAASVMCKVCWMSSDMLRDTCSEGTQAARAPWESRRLCLLTIAVHAPQQDPHMCMGSC